MKNRRRRGTRRAIAVTVLGRQSPPWPRLVNLQEFAWFGRVGLLHPRPAELCSAWTVEAPVPHECRRGRLVVRVGCHLGASGNFLIFVLQLVELEVNTVLS